MKTFKALFIDQGTIKAGEFPEPVIVCNQITECESPQRQSCRCVNYHKALASAKANAVECEDQEEAKRILNKMESALFLSCCVGSHRLDSTCSLNNRVVPLPSGWDYRVERGKETSVPGPAGSLPFWCYNRVAILYRTDEQKPLIEKHY